MSETEVLFPLSSDKSGAFRLVELPPDLLKLVEAAIESNSRCLNLSVKGHADEDAVLCTHDKTYTMRAVVLSNSVLVVTPEPADFSGFGKVVIRDQLHDIIELAPSLPKLHRLRGLLRGAEYDEGHEDDEMVTDDEQDVPKSSSRRKFAYSDAQHLQASEGELARGLKEMHILDIGGRLRPIAPAYLNMILELILNYLVSLSLPYEAVSVQELTAVLEDEYEIRRQVTLQVMSWFGDVSETKWRMSVESVLKQVGLGILSSYKNESIPEQDFLEKWRNAVGDTFESRISLQLLTGNFISSMSPARYPPVTVLTYFPCSTLPIDPAARFNDLFLTRLKWKAEDIAPYLTDIAVDSKERDKLLLKYARSATDSDGVWYTTRTKL